MALHLAADVPTCAADHAATAINATAINATWQRPRAELLTEIDALRGILASAPVIEQAKGAIMLYGGVTPDTAFAVLRRYSQRHNITVRDLAAELTDTLSPLCSTSPARELMDRFLTEAPTATRAGGQPW